MTFFYIIRVSRKIPRQYVNPLAICKSIVYLFRYGFQTWNKTQKTLIDDSFPLKHLMQALNKCLRRPRPSTSKLGQEKL